MNSLTTLDQVIKDHPSLSPPIREGVRAALKDAEELRKDAQRLNWIEAAANKGKIEIAKSLFGTGFEIAEWPSMRVRVVNGDLRAAIDSCFDAIGVNG